MGEEWAVIDPDDDPITDIGSAAVCYDAIPFGSGTCGEDGCLCRDPERRALFEGEGCACVDKETGQCLCGEDGCVEEAKVEDACADIADPNEQENCKFDVITTGDITWADAPW
eukprot:CAMPEP_0183737854 /NCGR_PEP_ID=MMETSP0737-20130205/53194_1 /TAXON_ID=385413 /ORGANISM="Thalassiosira miniscula, Strain CCMP1093" /LENGTH=112 /DNA_ID=CAMNT_0025972253 /DNA_START=610 /DNA_END=945 /DNA_ORIENTATION=+